MGVTMYSRLGEIAKDVVPKASLAVYKAAHDVEAHAKGNAPVDTGWLKSGITVIPQGPLDADVDANAEYAIYVEYGSTHNSRLGTSPVKSIYGGMFSTQHVFNVSGYTIGAQPFMVPAAETVRPSFIAAMKQIV